MKYFLFFSLFVFSSIFYAQETIVNQFETTFSEIEIDTKGLDEIVLENSKDNFVSIYLNDENVNAHDIVVKEESSFQKISFLPLESEFKDEVFRKFVTKRVNRAVAKIKIPKGKRITFLGNEIDIISKNYQGKITIFIEKGELQLNTIQDDVVIHLFSGNVFALAYQTNIEVKSNQGKILVDEKMYQKIYKKEEKNFTKNLTLNSIKANVVLNTQKTQ